MINIYCDESCHLENDNSDVMVLGAIACPTELKSQIYQDIRKIKVDYNLSSWNEIKWSKVSMSKLEFYLSLIDYFFKNESLQFRGIVATGKKQLNHKLYGNTYDKWYYIMYYYLLNPMILPEEKYKIFIDIKDTNGGKKIEKLHDVLSNSHYDFSKNVIRDIKQIHSNESELIQLCDLIIGALSYYHRGLHNFGTNKAKKEIINKIKTNIGRDLDSKTPLTENKFNLFIWEPRGGLLS